ncbi:ATP-dependent helicase HrpB [Sporomusa sp.]|uniref:ATP-dependent helicase HrpB n=1 Tax=Sporomusa sp. TaxID=2078658 RepID=UPI002CF37948|nr:ATP-dependent helicase HrpB [Sporomusa sp.]HWR43991.1 ATP-dependent helicase HrpB [Sporomusa sp.]
MNRLPIEDILPDLKVALSSQVNAVLVAPPGSGKTTRIPLALKNEAWLKGRRILMLEPRRLAARAAARYMAQTLGEQVGETVGYRVRLDSCVGPKTCIEVITEGILTRMLQTDQALEGVGLIIFDEFHERSLHADLGLLLALESQTVLREDLRLLVMSATLNSEAVAGILRDAPIIFGSGQVFPVETHYLERRSNERIEADVVKAVFSALTSGSGDILVFLPGAGEIRWVQAKLMEGGIAQYAQVSPLYGSLSPTAQDLAILPSPPGERKVVLATSIAETSLTVEGVRIVVDCGLMRVPHFSPRTGLTRLETIRVSRSAADQRRGRAGRLGPGVCFRLWTLQDDMYLEPNTAPEIFSADLSSLALELAAWGVTNPDQLQWLDSPPEAAFYKARELLNKLGAVGPNGAITAHGRQMIQTGLHPRLAHMILKAVEIGFGGLACELAAILSERDFFRGSDVDLRLRIEAIRKLKNGRVDTDWLISQGVDIGTCRRIEAESKRFKQEFDISVNCQDDIDACGLVLALAYPDRIGQKRDSGKFLLENGRGAVISETQPLAHNSYIVAAELDGQGNESRVFLGAPVALDQLRCYLGQQIVRETTVTWDEAVQAVRSKICERLGTLILKESPYTEPDPAAISAALIAGIAREGLSILPWTRTTRQLRQRLLFIHRREQMWPDVSDEALLHALESWLGPYVYGLTSRAQLAQLNLTTILEAMLSWEQLQELDTYAPTHLIVPSNQRIPIDYSDPDSPVLAVKLQEMFGLTETPCIARGKVRLTLHLLSPSQRTVQVTQDLANFWSKTYFEVKRDLMGRYPKHYWPDEPMSAIPTNRVRPKPV